MGLGQEAKNKKFLKEKNVFLKKRNASPRKKGMNNPSRRKLPSRFIISSIVSSVPKWYVVKHKKFLQKLTRTQKRRM